MFRKGGSTSGMTGIMSGITDRQNYEEAGSVFTARSPEEIRATMKSPLPEDKGFDPLTTFLLQLGPSIASARPTGSTIGTVLGAAEKPIESLLTEQAERRKTQRDIEAGLTQLSIEQAGKEKLLEAELQAKYKDQGLVSTETFLDLYEGSANQAQNRSFYENTGLEAEANKTFGDSYGGLIGGNVHGDLKSFQNKKNLEKIYFDVTDRTFKRLRRNEEKEYVWEPINIGTYTKKVPGDDGPKVELTPYQEDILEKVEKSRKIKEQEEKQKRTELLQSLPTIPSYLD